MKNLLKVLAWMLLGVLVIGFSMVFYLSKDLNSTTKLTLEPIDLSVLADGVYQGTFEHGRFSNQVKVTVQNQKIVAIEFTKMVDFDWPEVREALIQKVIARQNVDIDTITEATATSKAYLKSIEDALRP